MFERPVILVREISFVLLKSVIISEKTLPRIIPALLYRSVTFETKTIEENNIRGSFLRKYGLCNVKVGYTV